MVIKTKFNQTGGDQVQVVIHALPAPLKQIEIFEIKTNFDSWMNKWFDLEHSQQLFLQNMEPSFIQELANAIANTYTAGLLVNFVKEEKNGEDVPDNKNLIVHGLNEWQDSVLIQAGHMIVMPLMIRIQYS